MLILSLQFIQLVTLHNLGKSLKNGLSLRNGIDSMKAKIWTVVKIVQSLKFLNGKFISYLGSITNRRGLQGLCLIQMLLQSLQPFLPVKHFKTEVRRFFYQNKDCFSNTVLKQFLVHTFYPKVRVSLCEFSPHRGRGVRTLERVMDMRTDIRTFSTNYSLRFQGSQNEYFQQKLKIYR